MNRIIRARANMHQERETPCTFALITELEKALEVVAAIPGYLYRLTEHGQGSIGAHVRHNVDFVNALLRGIGTGSIDYANRERDPRVEIDQRYAGWKIRSAIALLNDCAGKDPGSLISVRSEIFPGRQHRSSFSREVEFVYTHTVHHHALINERLAGHGIRLTVSLGVAPSTQKYWDGLKRAA